MIRATKYRLELFYPCCGGRAMLPRIGTVPKQIWDRRCTRCRKRWKVTLDWSKPIDGGFIDQVTWESES